MSVAYGIITLASKLYVQIPTILSTFSPLFC